MNNSGGDPALAVQVFKDYDVVIFGNGIDSPTHGDHDRTQTIIESLQPLGTRVYGYVDLCSQGGSFCSSLPISEILAKTDRWAAMGAAGIFLDQAGYDYGVSRERLNQVVDYVHGKGMSAYVNPWNPDDVFSAAIEPTLNPSGLATHLGANDYCLHESFAVTLSQYQDPAFFIGELEKGLSWKAVYGTKMATVNTISQSNGAPIGSYRIFLDTDASAATGFLHSGNTNLGSEYLVENGYLYQFTGATQTAWSWTFLGSVSAMGADTSTIQVAVQFSRIGYVANRQLAVLAEHVSPSYTTYDLLLRSPGAWDVSSDVDDGSGNRWQPNVSDTWQWQLDGTVNTTYAVDVYDIDLFDSSEQLIRELHESDHKVVCYFSAGSFEDWRPDKGDFNQEELRNHVDGWKDEIWLDIRSANVREIMQTRLDLAQQKGCDGVEPDWLHNFQEDTGFPLTPENQLE